MAQTSAKKKPTKKKMRTITYGHITKKLQTEFQATIAFACYDSDEVLRAGKSARHHVLMDIKKIISTSR